MKAKLNAKTAFLMVFLYLALSIAASLTAAIFFRGSGSTAEDTNIANVIDSGMYANLFVTAILLIISIYVFKDSRRDIFFERKRFALSRLYYFYPLVWLGVALLAFLRVDYAAYSVGTILLVLVAALAIGINEELVTRGILLVGLRNSGLAEWIAWLLTVAVFALLHLVNVIGGDSPTILIITVTGGTLLYVSRRVFNTLLVPIALHALYDAAFYLLTGSYLVNVNLPDPVLDQQLASFLVLLVASVLFLIFGRRLLRDETTGWKQEIGKAPDIVEEAQVQA